MSESPPKPDVSTQKQVYAVWKKSNLNIISKFSSLPSPIPGSGTLTLIYTSPSLSNCSVCISQGFCKFIIILLSLFWFPVAPEGNIWLRVSQTPFMLKTDACCCLKPCRWALSLNGDVKPVKWAEISLNSPSSGRVEWLISIKWLFPSDPCHITCNLNHFSQHNILTCAAYHRCLVSYCSLWQHHPDIKLFLIPLTL